MESVSTQPSPAPSSFFLLELRRPSQWAWVFLSTFLCYGFAVRLRLFLAFLWEANPSPFYAPKQQGLLLFSTSLWSDMVFALWWAWGIWLLCSFWTHCSPRSFLRDYSLLVRTLALVVVHILLLLISFLYSSHHRVLFEMHSGLTYDLVAEAQSAFSLQAVGQFITFSDAFFLLLPIALFWFFAWLPMRYSTWRNRIIITCLLCICLNEWGHSALQQHTLHTAIRMTPLEFLVTDWKAHGTSQDPNLLNAQHSKRSAPSTTRKPPPNTRKVASSSARTSTTKKDNAMALYPKPSHQLESLRLFEPVFTKEQRISKTLPKDSKTQWNVVVVVLESLGTRYMFDTSKGNRTPMPFLKKWVQKGWYFPHHRSTANSSPRSLFSIFTGLYPIPQLKMFVMRKDAYIPTIPAFLPSTYSQPFLVTPAGLFWYFPKHFFRNNGPKDLTGARSKPLRRLKKVGSFPNEIDTTTHFIQRMKNAKEPFFATYVSFVPHGPYDDYGKKYRILPNKKKNFHRYINNLNVLDHQLKRMVHYLKTSGKLERTIIVMVGDHGQAFWQHRFNYGHSRYSYRENYEAPLMFYQPKLFKPKTWKRISSHVDILPTLLDALRIRYNPHLLQGESLFQDKLNRKQLYLFGNEQTLTSLRPNGQKMQYSLKRRRCWAYDLQNDPKERKRLGCQDYQEQWQGIRRYLQVQKKLIRSYNRSNAKGLPFFKQRHPTVQPRR